MLWFLRSDLMGRCWVVWVASCTPGFLPQLGQRMTDISYWFFTVLQSNDRVLSTIRGKTVTDFLSIPPKAPPLSKDISAAREAARKLESSFLAEMLKGAGFGVQKNGFSGG